MAGPPVSLIARLQAIDGKQREVALLLSAFEADVRIEPGNLIFAVNAVTGDGTEFFVYEEYADDNAFAAHLSSLHNQRFNRALAPLVVSGQSELTMLERLQGREDETSP